METYPPRPGGYRGRHRPNRRRPLGRIIALVVAALSARRRPA